MKRWRVASGPRRSVRITPRPSIRSATRSAISTGSTTGELAIYGQAIAIKPDLAGAYYNRGNVLQTLGRLEESLADYERAIALVPAYTDALNNRGNALLTLRRNGEAAEDFERVLAIDPDYPYARGKLLHARLRCCDWTRYDRQAAQIAADIANWKRSSMPFENIAVSDSPRDQLECARLWISDKCPPSATPLWSGQRYRHDRIRLAYLSADFHEHATAYLVAGLFEQHDRNRFETIAVSFGPDSESKIRTRLKNSLDRFIDVRNESDFERRPPARHGSRHRTCSPEGSDRKLASCNSCVAARSCPGELSRISRNHGRRHYRLCHCRPRRHS